MFCDLIFYKKQTKQLMYFPTIFLGVNQNIQCQCSNHSKSTENLHQDNLCALLIMTNFLPLHSEQTIPLKRIQCIFMRDYLTDIYSQYGAGLRNRPFSAGQPSCYLEKGIFHNRDKSLYLPFTVPFCFFKCEIIALLIKKWAQEAHIQMW